MRRALRVPYDYPKWEMREIINKLGASVRFENDRGSVFIIVTRKGKVLCNTTNAEYAIACAALPLSHPPPP